MENEVKRSAGFILSQSLLFELLGLGQAFGGQIDEIGLEPINNSIVVKVSGYDDRMPEEAGYPLCNVVCKVINSHFEKVEG